MLLVLPAHPDHAYAPRNKIFYYQFSFRTLRPLTRVLPRRNEDSTAADE